MVWMLLLKKCACRYLRPTGNCSLSASGWPSTKSASTSWQLFTQIRHFITQFWAIIDGSNIFWIWALFGGAPSGVPTLLLFWNRTIFVIIIIISISTIISSKIDCHHRYHHLHYYDHIRHHTDAQFEIIDNDDVQTAVAWKTYSNRPF